MNTEVGLIGLGLMGSTLAERFLSRGRSVVGFDPREETRQQLHQLGGAVVTSVEDVVTRARTLVFSLPNSDVVEEVCRVVLRLRSASASETSTDANRLRIIDTTTGDPDRTATLGQTLFDAGIDYLDATLTGSSQVARAGELIVTAGGPASVFRESEELFRCFAIRWFHVGSWGCGARTKLAVNLVLGLNRAVLAEGLAFARASGIPLETMLEILQSGVAYSRVMDAKGRKMIERDFAPEAKLSQHLKDVRLILESAKQRGAKTPLSKLHEQLLSQLENSGAGSLDNSAIIQAFATDND